MGTEKLSRQNLAKKWKEFDGTSRKPVGLKPVCRAMGISPYHVIELLQGQTLTEFKRQHAIRISPQETPYEPGDLLSAYDGLVTKYGRIPTWQQIRHDLHIPDSTFKKKFGATQMKTVEAYYEWLKKNKPESPNVRVVEQWFRDKEEPRAFPVIVAQTDKRTAYVSEKTGGRPLGKPLGYENFVYGPANEQGVVMLFAILSKRLRYNIEGVWTDSFPDCEATRVERGGNTRRVRIEFEYKSREFLSHGHPDKGCDVIVCWEDNWKDRPAQIEVLELSKVVEELRSAQK